MSPIQITFRLRVLRRILRLFASPRSAVALVLLAAGLAAIEVQGRRFTSDPGDVLMLLALGALLFVTSAVSGVDREALGNRVGQLWHRAVKRSTAAWPQLGVDFRPDPTIPHRIPPVVLRTSSFLALVSVLLVAWNVWGGTSLRALFAPRLYLLYLVLLAALWAGLLLTAALGVLMAAMTARHVLWIRGGESRGRARGLLAGWLLALLVPGLLLPVETALLLGVGAIVVTMTMTYVLRIPRLTLLWRTAADARVAASSWSATLWQATALPMAGVFVFLCVALGGTWSWWSTAPSSTPLTDGLAVLAAWCMGPGFLVFSVAVLLDLRRLAHSDPATPCPTTVHVVIETTSDERSRIAGLFEARGCRIRTPPDAPEPTDVRLRLVDSPMPRPPGGWPLPVSARALEVPELLDLIARRDVVQRRRLLRRGFERLLKEIRSRNYERGEGFWLAPHLWFVSAVTRDTEEDDLSEDGLGNEVGTPFARLFPLPVRHHLHLVFRAVQVDILLLEDGVRWSAFRRVLDRVFTHYDAGRGRIEERDFTGILGVRVILHDLEPGGLLEVESYPEPDYSGLARGRILHVFKDRGGQADETEPAPAEDTGVLLSV